MSTTSTLPNEPPSPEIAFRPFTVIAFVVALVGLGGSLGLTWLLDLKACPLCFYQRSFVMGLVAVLGMGLATGLGRSKNLGLMALPLAVAGLVVALFHVSLEVNGILECPEGFLGLGTAPKQSLALFLVLAFLLNLEAWPTGRSAWFGGVFLGCLLGVFSCTSNPPMPPAPKEAYPSPPEVCRRPFVR